MSRSCSRPFREWVPLFYMCYSTGECRPRDEDIAEHAVEAFIKREAAKRNALYRFDQAMDSEMDAYSGAWTPLGWGMYRDMFVKFWQEDV